MAVRLMARTKRLARLIRDDAMRQKELGASGNKRLRRRIGELRASSTEDALMACPGKWHRVPYDWPGCLAGTVTGDARIIVELREIGGEPAWLVLEIGHAYVH
ncbi:hypothetical protein GA0111570_101175 [Raineyella antarctica]|uniref:Proteic killer suppression protein n=1 Tax=Raineyella antarctica TaxID=1577474 RepID=A0A1G6GDJ3_9ACTN|nr:hypothetical protein [Raineyella antarctica]SDB79903.1 hypothetical protein GA0111570_101175 [Raineyella antarctica]